MKTRSDAGPPLAGVIETSFVTFIQRNYSKVTSRVDQLWVFLGLYIVNLNPILKPVYCVQQCLLFILFYHVKRKRHVLKKNSKKSNIGKNFLYTAIFTLYLLCLTFSVVISLKLCTKMLWIKEVRDHS